MNVVSIEADSLVLFHGTTAKFSGLPRDESWFSSDPGTALSLGGRENLFRPRRRWKKVRVVAATPTAVLQLLGFGRDVIDDYHAFASGVSIPSRGSLAKAMRGLGFVARGEAGEDQRRFAATVCAAGFDGWIIRDLYGVGGHDILICKPSASLSYLREWSVSLDDPSAFKRQASRLQP